ncbi:hypothetical protein TKK_0001965 [Trichogramma kaykai]|uniref:Gamma-secretase subunit Aph-1 n=1 Tax=Trichogramma kaykai TaxID=54128 RepID=A0ABD2X8I4_9HYME
MSGIGFAGCATIAFGPPFLMFLFSIAIEPIRIIMLIASAFCWLLSLLISSLTWYAIVPLRKYIFIGLIYSVIFQELFRFLLYKILRRAEKGLEKVMTAQVSDSRDVFSYVCGFGFGIMSGVFSMSNVLSESFGPGTMGLKSGNEYFFIVSAGITLCIIMLHTLWGITFFAALDNKNWFLIVWVVGSHMFVSLITLLNAEEYHATCIFTLYAMLLINVAVAFNVSNGRVPQLMDVLMFK